MPRIKPSYLFGLEFRDKRWWAVGVRVERGEIVKSIVLDSEPVYQDALRVAQTQYHATFYLREPPKALRPGAEDEE